MIIEKLKKNNGFTLVETMFAVLILTFTIVGLMTVVSNSLFAARYAKDEITVNYLLQEVIDSVRNDRDTIVFLTNYNNGEIPWDEFLNKYHDCNDENIGCYFDVLPTVNPVKCDISGCPILYYDPNASTTPYYVSFDGGAMTGMTTTDFKRKIVIKENNLNPDEIDVIVSISWVNGGMSLTRSLSTSFLKWQQ